MFASSDKIIWLLVECKSASFGMIKNIGHKSVLAQSREVTGSRIPVIVVLLDHLQRLTELEHGCELVLAAISAEAIADQIADFTVNVVEFDLVCFRTCNNGLAVNAVEVNVGDLVISIIIVAPLSDFRANLHAAEVVQKETAAFFAGNILLFFKGGGFKPGDNLVVRNDAAVEGNHMGATEIQLTLHPSIYLGNYPLVVGELILKWRFTLTT